MSFQDIEEVRADQADLIKIEHALQQVLNYKVT